MYHARNNNVTIKQEGRKGEKVEMEEMNEKNIRIK